MATKTVQIRGLEAINRKLKRLTAAEGKKAIRRGCRAAMKPVRAQAQADAPSATGKLRKAIKVVAGRTRKGVKIVVRIGKKNFVGDRFYGAFQEFGWKVGPRKLGDDRPQIEGKHFMEHAYEERGPQARDDAERRILAEVESLLAKGK